MKSCDSIQKLCRSYKKKLNNFFLNMAHRGEKHIAKNDPRMALVIKAIGPCTLTPRRQRFQSLVRAIVGQQISTKAARAVFERLRKEAGGYVTAERIGTLSFARLR